MEAADKAATQLDHLADPLSIRLRLNDFPFSLQSLIQDIYCLPLAAWHGHHTLEPCRGQVSHLEVPGPAGM